MAIRKLIRKIRRRYKNKFVSIDDVFYMARMQEGSYTPNKNKTNVVLGGIFVLYGSVTILLPTGSIFSIMLGLFLISCPISLRTLLKGLLGDIKFYMGCWL